MINAKIIFIIFGVITCVSVATLILYDQIEKNTIREQEQNGIPINDGINSGPKALESVLDSCECHDDPERDCFAYGAEFDNGTHYINNNSCEWLVRDLPIYPGMAKLPDTYEEDYTDDFEIDYTDQFE